jgi:hypothetical protein
VTQQPLDLYTDGGVIGANPSPFGGTWAYCIVDTADNQRVTCNSGVITPSRPSCRRYEQPD